MRSPSSIIRRVMYSSDRSPAWPSVRAAHLEREGWCRFCGGLKHLEVHHIYPVHFKPELELEPYNLITLCEALGSNCHFRQGHWSDWKNFNPLIRMECMN